jgi:predicted ferric reductase
MGTAGIALIVAPILLWVTDRGFASLLDPGQSWKTVASMTGLLASVSMVLQVLLMARIPWVERAWGHDVLTRRHRLLGMWSFALMLAHIGAITLGRWHRSPSATATLLSTFIQEPWMLCATAGTVLILGVVITSIRHARRRMRYESWHLLHLYGYLGMALALPHQIVDGPDFRTTAAQTYWWTLYGLTAAAVIIFRVATPIYRTAHHDLRVHSLQF